MKKIKLILIFVIIFNLILTVYLIFGVEKINEIDLQEYKRQKGYYNNLDIADILYFENYDVLKNNYNGEINLRYVTEEYDELIKKNFKQLYYDTKELNDTKLEKYFEDNQKRISLVIGIEKFSDFKNLIKILDIYKYEDLEYEKGVIGKNTIKSEDNFTKFDLTIYYNKGTLKFEVWISKVDNIEEAIIKFIPKGE